MKTDSFVKKIENKKWMNRFFENRVIHKKLLRRKNKNQTKKKKKKRKRKTKKQRRKNRSAMRERFFKMISLK